MVENRINESVIWIIRSQMAEINNYMKLLVLEAQVKADVRLN